SSDPSDLHQYEGPDPVAVLRAPGKNAFALNTLEAHAICAVPDHLSHLRVLEPRQDLIDAVHVEAQKVLDPVIGVCAPARCGTHLDDPRPDRGRRSVDLDRARRHAIGPREQFIARETGGCFARRRSPRQDPWTNAPRISRPRGRYQPGRHQPPDHALIISIRSSPKAGWHVMRILA